MRGVIKSVLAEELQNALRMKQKYEKALKDLPQGCLVVKNIRGHKYVYLVRRVGQKVKYVYKGKISKQEKEKYAKAKALRAKYRNLLSQIKKRIRFLRSSLRGKESV